MPKTNIQKLKVKGPEKLFARLCGEQVDHFEHAAIEYEGYEDVEIKEVTLIGYDTHEFVVEFPEVESDIYIEPEYLLLVKKNANGDERIMNPIRIHNNDTHYYREQTQKARPTGVWGGTKLVLSLGVVPEITVQINYIGVTFEDPS